MLNKAARLADSIASSADGQYAPQKVVVWWTVRPRVAMACFSIRLLLRMICVACNFKYKEKAIH